MHTNITHITAVFMAGNLELDPSDGTDVEASIEAYASEVLNANKAEYPTVAVHVSWRDESGSLPMDLEPSVTGGSIEEQGDAEDIVRDAFRNVFEQGNFYRDVAAEADVTDEQITALQQEAGQAGDTAQVALCESALAGDAAARTECARAIREAAQS